MSKAFTRESDDAPEPPSFARRSALPTGARNYLTPDGARKLREELANLTQTIRPALAGVEEAEARGRLREVDQRILDLQTSLQSAVVVEPPAASEDRVRFGATVAVLEDGVEVRYRIVGVDEADFDRGWVSWISPIAKALLNARAGDRVRFKIPSGEKIIEIVRVRYE